MLLSPLEGNWQEEVSFPQTPNQCQSKHTGTELSYVRSTVSTAVEKRSLFSTLPVQQGEEREGHYSLTCGESSKSAWGTLYLSPSHREGVHGKASQGRGHF